MPRRYWIKNLTYPPESVSEWKDQPWVSDGPPNKQPKYSEGDELLLYSVPDGSFPARARVTGETKKNAAFVRREAGAEAAKRWPFVTPIKVLGAVDPSVAPTPEMLGVKITQGGHRGIPAGIYEEASRNIPNGFRQARLTLPLSRPVAIEAATAEPFEQQIQATTRTAYKREQQLVRRFAKHLEAKGHKVTRHAITLPGGTELKSDLFDHQRGLLVEAKSSGDRPSIRMAIGQLMDYRRGMTPRPHALAVLVPERPAPDLEELLDSLSIGVIWESGKRFRDNRAGALT